MIAGFGNLGLHVIQYPSGRFGFVGSIPFELCETRKPTIEDVMGLRVQDDGLVYHSPVFSTQKEAIEFAAAKGYTAKLPVKA